MLRAGMAGNTAGLGCSGVVLSREACSGQGAVESLRRLPNSEKDAVPTRSARVPSPAMLWSLKSTNDGFDSIRTHWASRINAKGTLRLSLGRLRTQLHTTRCVLLTGSPLAAFEELLLPCAKAWLNLPGATLDGSSWTVD
ncbi:hypothetical protein OPT61_g10239 [Boeremia exigua]|uniref:Uncharacterized protein n=1 Tax=Boeremia exigua TaxID=749465 RepID=A0ACC2HQP5_9PLEO|nr:hypothetical protein OPT61_g10239 [Boeremia exigua]